MGCFVKAKYRTIAGVNELEKLCHRLKEMRLQCGLTQEEFAQISGLGYKFYQQIESGRKKQIWLETVQRLASAYSLETWQLLAPELPENIEPIKNNPTSRVHNKCRARSK